LFSVYSMLVAAFSLSGTLSVYTDFTFKLCF